MIFNLLAAGALLLAAERAEAAQPRPASAPPAARVREAEQALSALDLGRVLRDRSYTESTLRHVDALLAGPTTPPPRRLGLESVRALLLSRLDRKDEAKAIVERLLAARPAQVDAYTLIWVAASDLPDPKLMVASVEGMARTVGNGDPTLVFDMLPPELVFGLDSTLREQELTADRLRLAEALIAMGWQRADPSMVDSFRLFLIDGHLGGGRRDEAARLAREVVGTHYVLQLLVAKRYDGLVPAGDDLLQQMLAEEDRGTASKLAAAPGDLEAVHERIGYLRSVGRNEEAVALAKPWLEDIPASVSKGERGVWVVNDTAFALVSLGRTDEALALMRRLADLDMEAHPETDLIGPLINFSGMLWHTGRADESRTFIERLRPLAARHANEYGRMWVAGHAACANAALRRDEEAGAELRRLQGQKINQAALNMAFLCIGDLDASERLMIERLASDDAAEMLLPLQRFALEKSSGPALDSVRLRLDQVRERPGVRAAIDRAGRILTLPMNRTYYGSF